MEESRIEKRLKAEVKLAGGMAVKFRPDHMKGMPDRLVILPGGRCAWVELKAPGKRVSPGSLQEKRIEILREMGHVVFVIDSVEGVKEFVDEICGA